MNSETLNQIAHNILNSLRGGRSSHTEHLSLGQIKYAIKYYRALLLRRDAERNFNRLVQFEQDLGHVALENVDSADDANLSSGNVLKRTTQTIPTPIRLKQSAGLTFIGGSDNDPSGKGIPLMDYNRASWQQYNKYTADEPYAYYRDGYLYIHNDITQTNVYIRGVFEDPEKVFEFTDANGIDLYDENSPYPITSDMVQQITQGLMNGEFQVLISTPDDDEMDRKQNP